MEGKIPVPCEDLLTWANWLEHDKNRFVAQEHVGEFWVSTVFMGLDHNWGDGPPLLFETMVFRPTTTEDRLKWAKDSVEILSTMIIPDRLSVDDAPMFRTPTWEMALETHAEAVAWCRKRQEN